jgi:hypothetical protein
VKEGQPSGSAQENRAQPASRAFHQTDPVNVAAGLRSLKKWSVKVGPSGIAATPRGPLPTPKSQSGKWAPEVEVSADNRSRGSAQPLGQAAVVNWCEREVVGCVEGRHRDVPRMPEVRADMVENLRIA